MREVQLLNVVKFVHWQEEKAWIGYLQDYPAYWTQGKLSKT
jgi:hypothetical protein